MKFRKNIHHVLFFCFLSGAMCHRNIPTENFSGDFPLYTATEGQTISFEFPFTLARGTLKYLCKGECKRNGILIKTHYDTAQHGRYSIRYHKGLLKVTIAGLKTSDSGWYRCGVGHFSSDSSEFVEIRVTEVLTTFPTTTKQSEPQTTEETTATAQFSTKLCDQCCTEETGSTAADFITYPTTTKQPTEETTATDYSLVVCACMTVVGVVLLAVILLLLYKQKSKRETNELNSRGHSDKTNMEYVTYENCPPVPICEDSIYQSLDSATRDQDQIYFTLTKDV